MYALLLEKRYKNKFVMFLLKTKKLFVNGVEILMQKENKFSSFISSANSCFS